MSQGQSSFNSILFLFTELIILLLQYLPVRDSFDEWQQLWWLNESLIKKIVLKLHFRFYSRITVTFSTRFSSWWTTTCRAWTSSTWDSPNSDERRCKRRLRSSTRKQSEKYRSRSEFSPNRKFRLTSFFRNRWIGWARASWRSTEWRRTFWTRTTPSSRIQFWGRLVSIGKTFLKSNQDEETLLF